MKTVAFFNNKGGVGKTSLVYHLAWMYATHGVRVLVADLDPQANLTSMFLNEDELAALWDDSRRATIFHAVQPLMAQKGDILDAHVERPHPGLGLIPGHLALSSFEDLLSEHWPKCMDGKEGAFRVETAFHRVILGAARTMGAELVLIDVGPNLGAINRSALIAAEQVVLPLAPDLFSLQGMRNLGPTLRDWRRQWKRRLEALEELPQDEQVDAPSGEMQPAGYVVMQHSVRDTRPVKAYQRWMDRIPATYRDAVLAKPVSKPPPLEKDPYLLALLKHYRSLMPLAMDAHKPMFFLKPADGAIGAHVEAVQSCYDDFLALARRLATVAGLNME